eukprot:m.47245 g.47245  ORF g.47245 m.47245 type:complete len:55 (-) comp20447_c1_seq1:36-200(-)
MEHEKARTPTIVCTCVERKESHASERSGEFFELFLKPVSDNNDEQHSLLWCFSI